MFLWKQASAVSMGALKALLRKHEERETPEQEAAESPAEQKLEREAGVEPEGHQKKAYAIQDHELHKSKWQFDGPDEQQNEKDAATVRKAIHAKLKQNKHRLTPEGQKQLEAHDAGKIGNYDAIWMPRFLKGFEKQAKVLTPKARDAIPDSDFVYPKERRFPIHDKAHARNALARAHFAPDPGKVRRAVHARYPDLGGEKKEAFWLGFEKAAAVFSIKHSDIAKAQRRLRNLAGKARKRVR